MAEDEKIKVLFEKVDGLVNAHQELDKKHAVLEDRHDRTKGDVAVLDSQMSKLATDVGTLSNSVEKRFGHLETWMATQFGELKTTISVQIAGLAAATGENSDRRKLLDRVLWGLVGTIVGGLLLAALFVGFGFKVLPG